MALSKSQSPPSLSSIEQLVSTLGDQLDLTGEQIADVLWLTLELQKFENSVDVSPPLPDTNSDTSSGIPNQTPDKPQFTEPITSTPSESKKESNIRKSSEKQGSVYANSGSGGIQGLSIGVPDAPSLREPLKLAQALRPLMRQVATGKRLILDEAATVQRIAEERIFMPVLKAEPELWLDLALVIDESHSMLIWGHTIQELKEIFKKYGIFRDIRIWGLQPDETGNSLQIFSRMGSSKRLTDPKEIVDPTGRRLILIVSDCVSNIWRKGMMFPVLKMWTEKQPLTILQMLPEWMWRRTALDLGTAVGFKSSMMGVANQQLSLHKPLRRSRSIGFKLEDRSKIPVITLDWDKAAQWSQMLIGKADALVPGYLLPPELEIEEDISSSFLEKENGTVSDLDAAEIVKRFRMTTSPLGRELAGLLAASPVINLPVVRLIQESLLPKSNQVQVAEVFLGGLLRPQSVSLEKLQNQESESKTILNPDSVGYEFIQPEIRDIFLDDAPISDSIDVVNSVSRYVAEQLGVSLSEFMAVLKAPQQAQEEQREDTIKPFAQITARVLRKLGGQYVQFAEELEQVRNNQNSYDSYSQSFNSDASSTSVRYQVGGAILPDVSSYVTRDCDRQLLEALKAGKFCYVLNSRQMGKSSLMVRTLAQLEESGWKGIILDFSARDTHSDQPSPWYNGIINQLNKHFKLLDRGDFRTWLKERDFISPVERLSEFIETVLLPGIIEPIVIFVDEIDSTLGLPFTDDFFALIRDCYNRRAEKPDYKRLTFVLLGVAAPSELIRDTKRTPFNIGTSIDLSGFTLVEAQPLAVGLSEKSENPQAVLQVILYWTGGQPFLSQRLCQLVANTNDYITAGSEASFVEGLVRSRLIESWESQDQQSHLKTIRDRVIKNEQKAVYLLELYRQIRQAGTLTAQNRLEERDLQLSGLVVKREGKLQVYNRIYEAVFDELWIDSELVKLRPYSNSFRAWIASGKSDVSHLLRGQALREAEQWAKEKNPSAEDRDFLSASRIQEREEEIAAKEQKAFVEQAKKAEEIPPTLTGEDIFMTDRQTILILSANPKGTNPLRLGEEIREIKEGLRRSRYRDLFQIHSVEAVRVGDIQRAMLDYEPNIVHFCGNGGGQEGLVFEDEIGQEKLVSAEALASLFSLFADSLDCVLLNACYSEVQAKEISRHINSVIVINQAIGDRAAIAFAVGFYDALGANKGVDFAYKLGCNAISMQGIPEHLTPKLLTKSNITKPENTITSQRVFISYRSQEPDVSLAQEFHDRLQAAGHTAFMAAKSISWGENWIERIDQELKQCDYFLLLLSEQFASSDMVAGEVRTARGLRDKVGKPIILPIRVNLPIDDPLNYELRSVLQTIQQKSWRSPDDTPVLVQEILSLMAAGAAPEPVTVEIPVVATIEAKNRPPLPVADLELPGGAMPLESKFYVVREALDIRCYQEIEKKAGLIRIKGLQQMGKSSLLTRIRNHATKQGYRTINLDFLEMNKAMFTSSSIFLKRFCALVSHQLGISGEKVTEFWNEYLFGPKENCSDYIERYVLADLTSPLVLSIDELDRLFSYDQVAKEFLMLLRAWNEKAKVNETWSKLRIVIAYSTELYSVMDTNSSPFNMGLAVDLAEFTSSQVLDLATRHGLNWETEEIEQLMAMVGGHPYLVRLSLYHIANGDLTLPELLVEAPTDTGLFGEHLRRHLWSLQQHPELAQAFHQVIFSDRPVILKPMLAFKLNGMGLVNLKGNEVIPRYDHLYRPYFRSHLSLSPS